MIGNRNRVESQKPEPALVNLGLGVRCPVEKYHALVPELINPRCGNVHGLAQIISPSL